MAKSEHSPKLTDGPPSFTIPILVVPELYSSREAEGRLSPSGQSVGVSMANMGRDLPDRQRAGGFVTADNIDIVTDKADGTDSGAMAVVAFTPEFDAN
jgi:hypothetical protein